MGLASLEIDQRYSSGVSDLIDDFYAPALKCSKYYDRASGFFSSGVFSAIEAALSGFLAGNAKMRLVCSPSLTSTDADAIARGLSEQAIADSLIQDLDHWDAEVGSSAPSSILRRLIARGALEIKIAVPLGGGGMFHDKYGIFTDEFDESVAFVGSLNESLSGWSAYGNHETFEVFVSWDSAVSDRVRHYRKAFEELWNRMARGLRIIPAHRLPEVFELRESDLSEREALEQYRNGRDLRKRENSKTNSTRKIHSLQNHQSEALVNWEKQGSRGVIDFVTGGGKTVTALAAADKWLAAGRSVLILVPGQVLLAQWLDEIDSELDTDRIPVLQVGGGVPQAEWSSQVRALLEQEHVGRPCVIVATYESAKSDKFLHQVNRANPNLLMIADEVHSVGAPQSRRILEEINASARLGLSATPERFRDESGTTAIFEYFGQTVKPHFGISEAIRAGRLVEYDYRIHRVSLTAEEDEHFEAVSIRISVLASRLNDGEDVRESLERALIERANIVKEANDKVDRAVTILDSASPRYSHWLVYCNSHTQIDRLKVAIGCETRQGRVLEYHSGLKPEVRKATLDYFDSNGGILLAVHCLDQGVDIPKIDAAIVVASSTNPREFIQRRGRILRWHKSKHQAELHDIVTLSSRGRVALASDIDRAIEIADCARNRDSAVEEIRYLTRNLQDHNNFEIESDDDTTD